MINRIKSLGGMIFLSSPYTKFEAGIDQAHMEVCVIAARLVEHGLCVHCPIAESHSVAYFGDLDPLDSKLWVKSHLPALMVSSCLIIAKLKGWYRSEGVRTEFDRAYQWDKPIFFINPHTLEISEEP
jgi:hypothetical protein